MLLLDTCTFIWLTSAPSQLSARAASALEAEGTIHLSDVSVWEICLKWQTRKIALPSPPRVWITEQIDIGELGCVPIEPEHLYRCVELPDLHKDPFDRLLVSQALTRGAKLVTPDPAIRAYPIAVVW
ncbi:MAG TPA: type II toxin-antitoxin system VapC family toxin [Polyangiaceae bacterium]|nr:type II toxin-antitoxin system VapC family toxin [Polyangiaceae bacterium]